MGSTEKSSRAVASHLGALLGSEFSDRLAALLDGRHESRETCLLRVEAQLLHVQENARSGETGSPGTVVGYVNIRNDRPSREAESTSEIAPERRYEPLQIPSPAASEMQDAETSLDDSHVPHTEQPAAHDTHRSPKRRKVVGGLRLCTSARGAAKLGNGSKDMPPIEQPQTTTRSVRQVHSDNRFPLRNVRKEPSLPLMTPTSADKLIDGIWRQVHSEAEWSRSSMCVDPTMLIHGGMSKEAFRAVNSVCLMYHNQSQSSRALEIIVQAYWVDCYEARIAAIGLEQETLSATETRMTALREACAVLKITEKDMRNRLAIWRGYKEIKDAGGWASLVFSGSGIYRFSKYRIGFDEGLTQRLRQMRHGLELAADTLHPEWRQLLGVIGQKSCPQYTGHPHEWVIFGASPAVPLRSTYRHLQDGMDFQFVDESVIDKAVFGQSDPRRMPRIDPTICPTCQQRQSDDIRVNRCSCFPNLFGGIKIRSAVQIFNTGNAKNNGVLARSEFARGTAVEEFVGLITDGVEGVDVMVGGIPEQRYQIFQGQFGNFTRFINHSCHPNSQLQKFYWKGVERILVVSRGISADSEITVDYSDHYWKYLEKPCSCGETCCRFPKTQQRATQQRGPADAV